jgi:thiol-disulfide isomerase/thioredoxin
MRRCWSLCAALVAVALAASVADAAVMDLSNEQFFRSVAYPSKDTEKNKVALIMWYTDSCIACRPLVNALKKAAKRLDTLGEAARRRMFVAKINAANFVKLAREEGIVGFPTLKLYSAARDKPYLVTEDPDPDVLGDLLEREFHALMALEKDHTTDEDASDDRDGL